MNAYEKSVELNLDGTDSEKVAILLTLTTSDIIGTKLGRWLGERNLLSWDGGSWFGLLQDLIDDGTITGESLAGIRELKAVLVGPRGDGLETTSPIWAPVVYQTIIAIAQVSNDVSNDAAVMIDSFYALDGGRPYKDLTVEQFAAQRTAAVSEAALTSAIATKRGKLQDAHIAASDWIGENPDCTRDQVLTQFADGLSLEGWV